MEDKNKELMNDTVKDKEGVNLEYISNVVTFFDGSMEDIKNFECILTSVNSSLVFLDGNNSIKESDLLEYESLKERVDKEGLILPEGDAIVFTVKEDTELSNRGVEYVVSIVTPEWENGLRLESIREKMDKGLSNALTLCTYYDIESIAISNIYPYMPMVLVMDMLAYYLRESVDLFKEICAVRGKDNEGVYRLNLLFKYLVTNDFKKIYTRVGGDAEEDVLIKIEL